MKKVFSEDDFIIAELFANVKHFGFYIKPSSEYLNIWCWTCKLYLTWFF